MCQRTIQLTPEGESINKALIVLLVIDIAFVILRIVFGRYDILFSSLIAAAMLLGSVVSCNYYLLMFLFFFAMFDLFYAVVFLSLRIQNAYTGSYDKYLKEAFYQAGLGIECFAFVFMCVLLYYVFKAFKEFKAITLGYPSNSASYQPLNQSDHEIARLNDSSSVNPAPANGFKAFSGKGVPLGGTDIKK